MGLKPLSVSNSILKYADDTYLLVPQHSSVTLQTEFSHILDWSSNNKLKLNTLKTKEIVFHRPRLPKTLFPPLLPGIERVDSIKILGVMFAHTMSPTQHIDYLISQCNQRLFLLSQLKYQNLSGAALDVIFHALIVSKITYALPAFAGHITVADKNRINKLFRKAFRRHLVNHLFDIDTLIVKHDSSLFRSLKHPDHCLHYLLPETRSNTMQLRLRGHNYTLAQIQTTLFKNSFIQMSFQHDLIVPAFLAFILHLYLYIRFRFRRFTVLMFFNCMFSLSHVCFSPHCKAVRLTWFFSLKAT